MSEPTDVDLTDVLRGLDPEQARAKLDELVAAAVPVGRPSAASTMPAFLRRLAVREDSAGWRAPCPDRHGGEGFSVLVRADERAGRWRFECIAAQDGDLCSSEGELVRLLGLTESEIRLVPADVPWRSQPWSVFRDESDVELEFLIADLLTKGSLGFVSAPPKKGKTWVGIALSLSVSTGRALFGEYVPSEPRDVLYVALEGARPALRARIGCLARGLGLDPDGEELDRLHVLYRPRPFNLADPELAALLVEEARRVDAALIVVDVLRQAARGVKEASAEDFGGVRDALEPLLTEGRSVLLLHHFGKLTDTQKERTPGERMAGTGAMYGALDVGFFITKSENGARRLRLEVEARDFASPERIGVALIGSGSGPHGGFTYVNTATFEVDPTAAEDRDLVPEIEALFGDGDWRTIPELAAKETKRRKGTPEQTTVIGIGAGKDEVRAALEGAPERFVQVDGSLVGRHPTARPWGTIAMREKVTQSPESPESPPPFEQAELQVEQVAPTEWESHTEATCSPTGSSPGESGHLDPLDEKTALCAHVPCDEPHLPGSLYCERHGGSASTDDEELPF